MSNITPPYLRLAAILLLMLHFAEASAMDYMYEQGKRLTLAWNANDKVGITTGVANYGMMEQLTFWVSSKTSSAPNERSLYAVGYSLKENTHYYSYSPYKWQNAFDAHDIPCVYTGQKQTANADANHLSAFDYQMAETTPAAGACTFSYQHTGAVLRISFPAPSAMTVKTLNVKSADAVIATDAKMNIVEKTMATGTNVKAITLTTENISVAKGELVVCYLALPPQDLSQAVLSITVADDNGHEHYIASVKGPNIKAGKLYEMALTASQNAAKQNTAPAKAKHLPMVTASGVANPIAKATDIIVDAAYTVEYVDKPDVPTAIEHVPQSETSQSYFTLNGMKVSNVRKENIYIHNGKKIIRR